MAGDEKRRSERVIPFVSEEEVVVIRPDGGTNVLGKLMDLSEVGALIYLLDDADLPCVAGSPCLLSMYHEGKVFELPTTLARKNGRLLAFEFTNTPAEVLRDVHAKLIRMEVEWMRIKRLG